MRERAAVDERDRPPGLPEEIDRLVWVVTGVLLDGSERATVSWLHALARTLLLYANTPATVGGVIRDAPVQGLPPRRSLRSAESGLRRMGIDEDKLVAGLEAARARDDLAPRLPRAWAETLLAPVVWPAVAAVAQDGPRVAAARLQRLLDSESERKINPTRARPDGGFVSRSYLMAQSSAMHRLFAALVTLRARGARLPFLDAWTSVPQRPQVTALDANTDRSGPPRTTLRLVHRSLDARVKELLLIEDGQDELAAVQRATIKRLERGVLTAARNRIIFDLLAVIGMRCGALQALRRCDFEPRHRCLDGKPRPAIALRPRKNLPHNLVRWKVLPDALALEIVVHSTVLKRVVGTELDPEGPLIPAQPSKPELFPTRTTLQTLLAGKVPSPTHPSGRVALVPFSIAALHGEITDDPDSYLGYSPHRLRHSALQLAREGARQYMTDNGLEMDPECLSEVLLDHEVDSDRYGYADISTERGREKWTAVAAEVNWQMLTGDMGARKAQDAAGFRAAVRERNAVTAEIELLQQRIDSAFAAMERTARVTRRGDDAMTQILNLLRAQAGVSFELSLERRLETRRRELDVELERIRHDPNRLVLLPDDAPPEDQRVDLDRIERDEAAVGGGMVLSFGGKPAVRDWITVNELAELASVSPASARRWASGQLLPFPAGDPRNPWLTPVPPVDQGTHARRRRIAAAHLSPEFLAPPARIQLLEQQLAGWPVGWSIEECERPLELADGL